MEFIQNIVLMTIQIFEEKIFLKNLVLKKKHPAFKSDMEVLLPIECGENFDEAYQFFIEKVISKMS